MSLLRPGSSENHMNKENIGWDNSHNQNDKRVFGRELNPNFQFLDNSKRIKDQISKKHFKDKKTDTNNPQIVFQYQSSIMEHLLKKESNYKINPDYFKFQRDITPRMRYILVDWLVDVNLKFKFLPETFFQTINVLDRYLSKNKVDRQNLQLVGIASLMLVSKYVEIYPPQVKDYMLVCDKAYTIQEILDCESKIILSLNFNLADSSSFCFLEHFQVNLSLSDQAFTFSRYILENALFDLSSLKYSNSELAAGAVFLVNKIFKKEGWRENFENITCTNEMTARNCAKELFKIMQNNEESSFNALRRKFSKPDLFEISKYKIERIEPRKN